MTTVVGSPPSEIARGATRPSPALRVNSPDAFPRVGTLVGLTPEVDEDVNVVVEEVCCGVVAGPVTVVELELEEVVELDELPQADPVRITDAAITTMPNGRRVTPADRRILMSTPQS